MANDRARRRTRQGCSLVQAASRLLGQVPGEHALRAESAAVVAEASAAQFRIDEYNARYEKLRANPADKPSGCATFRELERGFLLSTKFPAYVLQNREGRDDDERKLLQAVLSVDVERGSNPFDLACLNAVETKPGDLIEGLQPANAHDLFERQKGALKDAWHKVGDRAEIKLKELKHQRTALDESIKEADERVARQERATAAARAGGAERHNTENLLTIVVFPMILAVVGIYLGTATFAPDVQRRLVQSRTMLELAGVATILVVIAGLGSVGKLDSQATGALLGSIAGYVLGRGRAGADGSRPAGPEGDGPADRSAGPRPRSLGPPPPRGAPEPASAAAGVPRQGEAAPLRPFNHARWIVPSLLVSGSILIVGSFFLMSFRDMQQHPAAQILTIVMLIAGLLSGGVGFIYFGLGLASASNEPPSKPHKLERIFPWIVLVATMLGSVLLLLATWRCKNNVSAIVPITASVGLLAFGMFTFGWLVARPKPSPLEAGAGGPPTGGRGPPAVGSAPPAETAGSPSAEQGAPAGETRGAQAANAAKTDSLVARPDGIAMGLSPVHATKVDNPPITTPSAGRLPTPTAALGPEQM